MKKFELTTESKMFWGKKLFRIRALISFDNVKKGELGGWVEKEENLSHFGNAWVSDNAHVGDDALVCDNAQVYTNAGICGNAQISGNAHVCDNAHVFGNAWVYDNAQVYGSAYVLSDTMICGDARVCGDADHIVIGPIGSRKAYTTFYRRADGETMVVCGCFHDTLIAFKKRVAEEHGDNQHGKMYMAAIEFARKVINTNAVSEGKEGDTQ